MKVTLDTAILAAGGSESPADLRIVQSRESQWTPRVRADFGANYARGNRRHDISFTVTKQAKDLATATRFILEYPESLPNQGLLMFEEVGPGTLRRYIAGAVLVRVELLRQIGVTTVWGFSLTGGEIVAKNPLRNPSSGGVPV